MKRMLVGGMLIPLVLMGCQSPEEEATTVVEDYLNVITEANGDVDQDAINDYIHQDADVDEDALSMNDFDIGNPEMVELELLELEYVKVPFTYSDEDGNGDDEYLVTDTGGGKKIIIGGSTLDNVNVDTNAPGSLSENYLERYEEELYYETYESEDLKEAVHDAIQED